MTKRLLLICQAEGLQVNEATLACLVEGTNGDIRAILGQLQMIRLRRSVLAYDDAKVQREARCSPSWCCVVLAWVWPNSHPVVCSRSHSDMENWNAWLVVHYVAVASTESFFMLACWILGSEGPVLKLKLLTELQWHAVLPVQGKMGLSKDADMSPFEAGRKLLALDSAKLTLNDRIDLVFQDADLVPLLVQVHTYCILVCWLYTTPCSCVESSQD